MQLKNILSFLKRNGRRAGFTMIELLVVIAILGILAATVLAAINPVEQINRARDTREQSDAAQLITAVQRYYSANQVWPWRTAATSAQGAVTLTWSAAQAAAYASNSVAFFAPAANPGAATDFAWGASMETTGELVKGLLARLGQQNVTGDMLYVWKPADVGGVSSQINACFLPRSFTFKSQAATDCMSGKNPANPGNGIPNPCFGTTNQTAANLDYICLP